MKKIPYQRKGTLSKKYLTKKRYPMKKIPYKKPYQESKKGALSWSLTKSLKKVPYQES